MNNDSVSTNSRRSRLVHRLKHDRGAVLVEAAICIPILLLVILGAVEAGLGWEAKSATVSGVRTGVLRASTIGDRPDTDLRILQSVVGEVGADDVDRIEWVMVFEANDDPDQKFNDCLGTTGGPAGATTGGAPGCLVYDNAFLDQIVALPNAAAALTFQDANFDTGVNIDSVDPATGNTTAYTCDTAKRDADWCAAERTVGGDTQIGVAVRYNHAWFTGIFPFTPPIFQEYVISSTFSNGGSAIDPASPVALAFTSGTVADTSFDAGFDFNAFGSDVVFSAGGGNSLETSPNGSETFWGRFVAETTTIRLRNQEVGAEVCVEFDLLVIGSWDATSGQWGPDSFDAHVSETNGTILDTDSYVHAVGATSSEPTDRLGYSGNSSRDITVPLRICGIVPANGELIITFRGNMIQNYVPTPQSQVNDESWAIDDLVITTAAP